MGYTYGNPLITKLDDGTWVAIVTSGYDNVPSTLGNAPSGDGKGHIYVIDMASGTLLYRIDTGDGSTTNPSNLGRINNWVSDSVHDNTTLYLYVGDMHGNLWRATLPLTTPSAGTVLSGSSTILDIFTAPTGQMITVRPELGSKDGSDDHRMILFGTGRYLSTDDKIDQTQQSIYGIYDDTLVTSTTPVTQSSLVQQTLCGQGISPNPAACTMTPLPTTYRTTTTNTANLGLGTGQVRGWYVNLPDVSSVGGSERVNIDPILQQGTLTVASNVPTSSDCNTGGYSWLYFLDYLTGSFTATSGGSAGVKINNSMVVGISEVFIDGTGHIESTNADSSHIDTKVPPPPPPGSIKRVGWRELFSE
jgi:type IV pilus assembly protein PilY1